MPKGVSDPYLAAFESFEKTQPKKEPSWIRPTRRAAISRFAELGFPTPRDEDWKYTNVAPIVKNPFPIVSERSQNGLSPRQIQPFILDHPSGPRLVFVNGFFAPKLSQISKLPKGVTGGSLSEALLTHSEVVEAHLGRHASYEQNGFTALNTAFIRDGAFLWISPGAVVEEPLLVIFISSSREEALLQPRNLILLEKGSQANVLEIYLSESHPASFTNVVTEIILKEGARLDYAKIQREDAEKAFHIATTQVHEDRDSRFHSFSLSLGAKLARENLNVLLDAEGTECVMDGLYLVSQGQHIDHHTLIDHSKPHGTSRQLYKGVIDGHSTAVFNGKVFVRKDAQKSDAEQTNKNLLLSDEAHVDTKPQLEIFADDVKCTHGAAVGQLDEEQIFYLKTRGLDEPQARGLLTYGFASEVIHRVKIESLRKRLDQWLWDWLG